MPRSFEREYFTKEIGVKYVEKYLLSAVIRAFREKINFQAFYYEGLEELNERVLKCTQIFFFLIRILGGLRETKDNRYPRNVKLKKK